MYKNYVLVPWPESQEYMEESWFEEEAILGEESSYFIPVERLTPIGDGVELIAKERQRQIVELGFTDENDNQHNDNALADAGASYAFAATVRKHAWPGTGHIPPQIWPWSEVHWKPSPKDRIKELAKAGALIAAEIDKLQRKK